MSLSRVICHRFSSLYPRVGSRAPSSPLLLLLQANTTPAAAAAARAATAATLYTKAALGLDQYCQTRTHTHTRFQGLTDSFKERMRELLKAQNSAMIFTEDFKNVLHLAEPIQEDLGLVREMARRFNRQHEGLRFGMYVFGPVVMRTYHTLGQSQEAFEALQDPELNGFFDQLMSYQIAMDLIFESGNYQQVLEVFEAVQEKRIGGIKYPKNCLNLAIAACYKMNTPASLHYLQELLKQMQEYGINVNRRLLLFGAALSLSLGQPDLALDLTLRSSSTTHIGVRSIKVIALSQLGRIGETLVILRSIAERDALPPPTGDRNWGHAILQGAVSAVEEAVRDGGNLEEKMEFERLKKCLLEGGAISDKTLDTLVTEPIQKFERRLGQDEAMLAASFSPRQHHHHRRHHHQQQQQQQQQRPALRRHPGRKGLVDME